MDVAQRRRAGEENRQKVGLILRATEDTEVGYGSPDDPRTRLWITQPFDDKPATVGNGTMPALVASSRQAVDAFHKAALAAGGTDEGAPGLRPYGPAFYAAYVRDPDGNKLSAVHEGP